MTNNIDKPLCDHCGQTLEHFLNQMEEHNLEVVCPSCGKTLVSGSQSEQADESNTDQHSPNRPTKPTSSNVSSRGNSSGPQKR
ncbi:MAG TPA: hypothetical protein VL983_08070 [Terriglobales bacterium]|nr:hypothetical protein [Terriglobales bacterium]